VKLFFLILVAFLIALVVYSISSKFFFKVKKQKILNLKPIIFALGVLVILIGLIGFGIYQSSQQPDIQCSSKHTPETTAPASLVTANDYMQLGDFDYETGNCQKAIIDYTKAIEINPNFAQGYNNRAYTNMRLRNYQSALPDLDKAIELNPKYTQALMNRGDIHNYYYQIDRQAAVADYRRVIAIDGPSGGNNSVCGHLFLAKHNGWTLGAYLGYFTGEWASCK
jgi:tetratricopeptide (TPR) repeat protein